MTLKTKSIILGIVFTLVIAMGIDIGLHLPSREATIESLKAAQEEFDESLVGWNRIGWLAVYLWAVEKDLRALLDVPVEDICLCELPYENDFFLRVIEKIASELGVISPGNTRVVLKSLRMADYIDRMCMLSMMPIDLEDWIKAMDGDE